MYVYRGVSREEWLFRGLAIAMIFAMIGMAVIPTTISKLGGVALVATYDPSSIWWWVSFASYVLGIAAIIICPPVGLAARVLTAAALL